MSRVVSGICQLGSLLFLRQVIGCHGDTKMFTFILLIIGGLGPGHNCRNVDAGLVLKLVIIA